MNYGRIDGISFRRFFFKTTCDDPDNPVIQVEIDNDADLLPLLDGKVDCKVKEYE